MSRYLRYLRIFWTVFCGIACVLLIVLWVRSYWYIEQVSGTFSSTVDETTGKSGDNYSMGFGYLFGCIGGKFLDFSESASKLPHRPFAFSSKSADNETTHVLRKGHPPILGFQWRFQKGSSAIYVPFWFPTLIFAVLTAITAAPWMRLRFSVRTLLIATTLVAVVLGLIVAVLRWPAG